MSSEKELSVIEYGILSVALMTAAIAILNDKSVPVREELILTGVSSEDIVVIHVIEGIIF